MDDLLFHQSALNTDPHHLAAPDSLQLGHADLDPGRIEVF